MSAQGQGGRQVRDEPDQMFDHFAVEYTFADGTRMMAQGRHMPGCWGYFGDVVHGTTGCAVLGEGVRQPRLFEGYAQATDDLIRKHEGKAANAYQVEHDLLFDAIRAEGLAKYIASGDRRDYEVHIRDHIPGLLDGEM